MSLHHGVKNKRSVTNFSIYFLILYGLFSAVNAAWVLFDCFSLCD